MENRRIDAKGLACPLPVIQTKQAADEMQGEGEITVLVDNEIAVQNLLKFAQQRGYQASAEQLAEREYQVKILVGTQEAKQEKEIACAPDDRQAGLVVVLSANVMGTGDEKLGKALMKAFVFSLTKQDKLPQTILCYNTGAYLTNEGADTLEDLKLLEAEGVQILTCGTCLDFYGIKDGLAVGGVTNMYEIVQIMEQAQSLVRP